MRTTLAVAGILAALTQSPARADVAPPYDGSTAVETCTLTGLQPPAELDCVECIAWDRAADRCAILILPYCYQRVCKTSSARTWYEVYCRASDATAPPVPSDNLRLLLSPTSIPIYAPDGGVVIPSSCLAYAPSPSAIASLTALMTAIATQTSTTTQSSTKTQTLTATLSPTETQTATACGTETSTTTSTATSSKPSHGSSTCSMTRGQLAVRALGPLILVIVGLLLVVLRRRSRG
jgi:hypothetical protein